VKAEPLAKNSQRISAASTIVIDPKIGLFQHNPPFSDDRCSLDDRPPSTFSTRSSSASWTGEKGEKAVVGATGTNLPPRGIKAVIPSSARRKPLSRMTGPPIANETSSSACSPRLKDFRRIATRYDKLARNYLAGVLLAAATLALSALGCIASADYAVPAFGHINLRAPLGGTARSA